MKIAYNPKTAAVITAATAANDDILFDLNARKVWARGLRMGADWADISSKPSSLKNPYAIKFRDINGNKVSYDGSSAKDLTTGTYIAKLPYGFSSFAPKPTWGNTIGTSIASWNDSSGGSIDFRKDNPSSGKLSIKVDGRVYVNEGVNPVLSAESNNGFWGMRTPDGGNDWIRTPNSGLIPYVQGNAGSGHSSLGASGWYFSTAYIDKVYGSLKGNADTATTATTALKADKLTNARNISLGTDLRGSANFDGSGNITINATINSCSVSVGSTDGLHFKRIAHLETGNNYNDNALLLYISQGYINGSNGICRVEFRTDNISSSSTSITASAAVRWLVRNSYGLDSLQAGYYVTAGKAYIDIYLKTTSSYQGTVIRVLQDSRGGINSNVQLISARYNSDTDHKEAYNSIEDASQALYKRAYTRIVSGSDVGIVSYSNSTGSVHWNNVTNKPGSFTPSSHTHTWASITDKIVAGNEFNIVNAGFDKEMWINFRPINDRNKTASIHSYIMGNGAEGMALVAASGFKKNGSNDNYVLLGGGSHAAISQLSVKYATSAGSADSANKLNKWFSSRVTDLNQQFGDGALRIFNATSSTTANKCPTDASILHLAWDNNGGFDSQLAIGNTGNNIYFRGQTGGTWNPWRTVLHDGNSSISGSTITINGSSLKLNIANWDTAYNFVSTITGTDTDNVINKWDEIVNFLAGITEDNKLNTLLNSKLSVYKLADKTNVGTIKNNGIYYSTSDASSGTLTNSPFNNGFTLINMTSLDGGDDLRRSRLAFNAFGEIKVSDDRDQANTAETWYNVLTSKNSGISGSTIKLNGTSITVYSSGTADGRYVKKSGDTMTGALNFANNTWNIVGDDVAMGDCNIAGCLGIKGLNGSPGLAFYNSSNTLLSKLVGTVNQFQRVSGNNVFNILDTSSTYVSNGKGIINGTTITQVDNADTVDGEHASAFTRIVGRHIINTNGTAPYNYIYLFRIANSNTNSTLDCEIDFRSRYHSAKLEIRIVVGGLPYGANSSVISIVKKVINGRSCNFWVLPTVQSSGYNYYDIYYQSGGWNFGSYDIILRDGSNSKLVFEHKGTNLDALPPNASVVNNQWVMWNDIAGKPSSFTPAEHNHDGRYLRLSGQDTMQGNLNLFSYGSSYIGRGSGDKSGEDFTEANIVIRSWYGISFKSFDDKVRTYIDTRTGNIGTKGKFIGNLTGNATSATSATKVIVNQHTTNDVNYPLVWSNQSNTSNATENQLYKSWQDLYYNPKNKRLFVGGSVSTAYINATSTVTSAGFKHSAVTKNANQYVLTADGGYTFLNQASNELAHEFSKNITVTSEWTDIKDFYGGNQSFLTQPGTYIVQVYYTTNSANSMYEGYFSGIMSWYTGKTNSNNADEIVLHRVGHAYANTIYLRTRESLSSEANPYTKLQISANSDLKQHTYKFKFKRIC